MILSRSEIEQRACAQFGEPNQRLSSLHELRFGRKGSVSVRLTGEKSGVWFDHEAQQGGSLVTRDDLPDNYERPTRRVHRISHDSESAQYLERALRHLSPVSGTPAELYLSSRGITAWPDHSIRFCRSPFGLAGLAQDGVGNIRAMQIVYLTDDGRKRREEPRKRTYTAVSGWHEIAAVRMPGRGEPILCEGIETGLSIWCSLVPRRPVLVCLGGAGVRSLRITSKKITIARDGDRPGSKADIFHQRTLGFRRNRYRVRVAAPPADCDFNDVLKQAGPTEVERLIEAAT